MYDEGADAAGPAQGLGGAVKRFNLEGLIPLILLVIIGVASLNYFGIIDVPYYQKEVQEFKFFLLENHLLEKK